MALGESKKLPMRLRDEPRIDRPIPPNRAFQGTQNYRGNSSLWQLSSLLY
jgi:hypothetical protein